ncbi:oocyte-secreted protein 3 [Hippopotamus amphibius kiboko]|uniref:oocyte-secreted protein 3 n=1 Tax=Hippopotamus amphibius kiboko TaxID=575201 RepID=UPI0025913ACC|nr:oocyte-secreted protein 3 [Hippopotamus amphibius kiboko]
MKTFVGLRSSLLFCMILAFSEQESVSTRCTSSTFRAVVPPTLLGQGYFLHSDEVSLGTGCPVTNVIEKGYEFNYLVTECGIQKEVFSHGVIFYSVLYCNIMHKGVTGKIPLRCMVFSLSFLDTTPSTINNNLTKFKNGIPSASSYPPWSLSNPCLFGLPWIPYFQHSSVNTSHQSLPVKMPHSLVHESANVAPS